MINKINKINSLLNLNQLYNKIIRQQRVYVIRITNQYK
jgi:hypothetical protein